MQNKSLDQFYDYEYKNYISVRKYFVLTRIFNDV